MANENALSSKKTLGSETSEPRPQPGKRGFAGMDDQARREIARLGGKAAHEKGTAHEFTPEEARIAGQKSHSRGSSGKAK